MKKQEELTIEPTAKPGIFIIYAKNILYPDIKKFIAYRYRKMRRDEDMRKMVSLLLFLVMIMYTSSISFADENNDNIESIVESHSSEKMMLI